MILKERFSEIMLVEDDKEDQEIMLEMFAHLDWDRNIKVFDDVDQLIDALSFLNTSSLPQLIVLDNNLPRVSGFEALPLLKKNDKYTHIPVIIYSNTMDKTQEEKCKKLGACFCFKKPATINGMNDLVREIIGYAESLGNS